MSSESDYHSKRQMFFVINNELVVAEKGSEKSHLEWLISNGKSLEEAERIIDTETRGVVNPDGQILFYKGKNWETDWESEAKFFEHLPELVQRLNLPIETPIGGGAVQQEIGRPWQPRKRYGLVRDCIEN